MQCRINLIHCICRKDALRWLEYKLKPAMGEQQWLTQMSSCLLDYGHLGKRIEKTLQNVPLRPKNIFFCKKVKHIEIRCSFSFGMTAFIFIMYHWNKFMLKTDVLGRILWTLPFCLHFALTEQGCIATASIIVFHCQFVHIDGPFYAVQCNISLNKAPAHFHCP